MGEKHPIEGIMYTAMQGLKDMIDVNTIVGEAVTTPDGSVIIPISKVAVGFGVGGSEFENA
ncbi:MAG: spore germination protein GerW family protein, partial [Oscillospiraceae bacterium]